MTKHILSKLALPGEPRVKSVQNEFAHYFEEAEFFYPILEKHIHNLQPKKVVEIGSGIGLLSMLLSDHVDEITGYEPSSAGYERVRDAQNVLTKVAKHSAKFEQTYFPGTHTDLDLIYAVNVIEHIHEWRSIVAKALDCLSPGGEMVLIFPNYTIPYEPHYHLPIIFGKRITRVVFRKKIESASIDNSESHWADLSFPKYRYLRDLIRSRNDVVAEFSNEVILAYLDRLDRDTEFNKRKKGIFFSLIKAAKSLKILEFIFRKLPNFAHPVIYVTLKKNLT